MLNQVVTLPGFDPLGQEFLSNPYPWMAKARDTAPVFYHPDLDIWVVTGFDNVRRAGRDHKTFSSCALGTIAPPPGFENSVVREFALQSLIAIDPPEHTASRAAMQRFFTPARIQTFNDYVTRTANDLIASFRDDGRCDLMEQFCLPFSLTNVIEFLGVPAENASDYRQWAEDLFSIFSPRNDTPKPMAEAEAHGRWSRLEDSARFFTDLADQRRADPKDDVLTSLVNARTASGEPAISPLRIVTHMNELVAAGHDTTANLIGHIVLLLSRNPDQLAKVLADPSLWPNVVEEGLRIRGSAPGLFRITTCDVEMGGMTIPKGAIAWLMYSSGGLDGDRFEDPSKFDIMRTDAGEHTSFGFGRHTCLGNMFARLEARIALQCLYAQLPGLHAEPEQHLDYLPTMNVVTLKGLEVEWERDIVHH